MLLTLGRALLGLCFALDGAWWIFTWDVRAAYLERIGAPAFFVAPVAAAYVACGVLVALGRAVRPSVLTLVAVAGLIGIALHTDLGPGGIGEYPVERHAEINSEALLAQVALVGALMTAFAAPDPRGVFDLRAAVVGRVLIGAYFVVSALWQAHHYDARAEALEVAGAFPALLPGAIGLQIVFGMALAAGRAVRSSAAILAAVSLATTAQWHGDLSPGASLPPNAQIHRWFVEGSLLGGILLLIGLGSLAAPPAQPVLTDTRTGARSRGG